MGRLLALNTALLTRPSGLLLFLAVTLTALFGLRAFLFPGIGGDDGEQLIFAQSFAWGYQLRNPPLYTWLVMVAQHGTGASVVTVISVKFALLGLTYLFLWSAARKILADRRLAALSALSPLALYYVAWDSVNGYSHSVLAMCLMAGTLAALLRLERRGATVDYLLLGFALGLGLLSKYNFALFAFALFGAALLDEPLRQRLLTPRLILTALVAVVLTAPHFRWLSGELAAAGPSAPQWDTALDWPSAGRGLGDAALSALGFLSPLWLILVMAFPGALKPRPASRFRKLLGRYFLLLALAAVAGIVVVGAERVRAHYMFVLIPFPLYAFARIAEAGPPDKAIARYALALTILAVLTVTAMTAKFLGEPLRCARCQHHIPYPALAAQLRDAGFRNGTIFAYWHPDPLAGNLKARLPEARVIDAKHPKILPPPRKEAGQCLLVWPWDETDTNRRTTLDLANRELGTNLATTTPGTRISANLAGTTDRSYSLGFILVDEGAGTCR